MLRRAAMVLVLLGLGGCGSSYSETQYVYAHDPQTAATNYFRVQIEGSASLSGVRFSSGEYDRAAVQKVFSETEVAERFQATRKLRDTEAESARTLDAWLTDYGKIQNDFRQDAALRLAETMGRSLEDYAVRVEADPDLNTAFGATITRARGHLTTATTALGDDPPKLVQARTALAQVAGILGGMRTAVFGDTLVYFFDGAGNPIEVSQRAHLIFAASDASRFTSAIKGLAESEDAQRDLLRIVMGERINEAATLQRAVSAQLQRDGKLVDYLLAEHATLSAGDDPPDVATLRQALQRLATTTAGSSSTLTDPAAIRAFVQGAEAATP